MKTLIRLFLFVALILFTGSVSAQIDIQGKIRDKVNNRANNHVDNAIDKGLDAAENGVKDAATKDNEDGEVADEEQESEEQDSDENDSNDSAVESKPQQEKVSIQSFTKYDFVPGDKVLFYEDFSQDAIGDFPALWTTNGSGEVKTVNVASGNWLHMNARDGVYVPIDEIKLPENFICEFDIITTPFEDDSNFNCYFSFYHAEGDYNIDDLYPGNNGVEILMENGRWLVKGYKEDLDWKEGGTETATVNVNEVTHVIVWVQKARLRIYHQGKKAVDLPTVLYTPTNFNHLRFSLWGCQGAPHVTNIRFTTAGADTRSKLLTEGKLISYGIYFDVNKDVVKPESYGALNDIAKILKENPDVRVKIIGYTDSDGADAANLDLSKRRGAAVKNELVKNFGLDASHLESDGKGESSPIAPNDTPSNKSLNRRVEFIKL